MPCVCGDPYNNGKPLVVFNCGHACHLLCGDRHYAERLQRNEEDGYGPENE